MGISDSVEAGFSDDVLKVEISGPDKPELTLVDLPGLYYSTSSDQDAQGRGIVRALTERYMKNTRSIILAVISAKTDYHLQEVLNIAEKYDPHRERTLGIVTQPDILEADSEEQETWLRFVKNEKIRLQLGWHALKNRKFETRSISHEERDEQEKNFFNEGRWRSVSRSCVGIDSLRSRLSNVLFNHIRRNIPDLVADINGKILDCQQKIGKLGAARSTLQQQKGFLLNISSNFEKITDQALNGMYTDTFFGGLDQDPKTQDFRRLRAVVRELNEYFAEAMEIRGCRRLVYGELFHHPPSFSQDSNNPYLDNWAPLRVQQEALEEEVREQARKKRGVELPGSANQLLVGDLFRDQSKPWEEVARSHLLTTWESVRYFISLVLQHLADEHTCSLLGLMIVEPELTKMKERLLEKLAELTSYTKRGHPLPIGKSFLTRIQKSRSERQLRQIKSALDGTLAEDAGKLFGPKDLERAMSSLEIVGDEFGAAEIIEEMQAYYDIAIVTFVDNIATLGIENCLLGPLAGMFTSLTINNMDDKQIQELAAEPGFVREERERLNSELEKLQAGLRTFASFNVYKPSIPLFAAKTTPTVQHKSVFDSVNASKKITQPNPFGSDISTSNVSPGLGSIDCTDGESSNGLNSISKKPQEASKSEIAKDATLGFFNSKGLFANTSNGNPFIKSSEPSLASTSTKEARPEKPLSGDSSSDDATANSDARPRLIKKPKSLIANSSSGPNASNGDSVQQSGNGTVGTPKRKSNDTLDHLRFEFGARASKYDATQYPSTKNKNYK